MKIITLLIAVIACSFTANCQLPAAAQALYDEALAQDASRVQFAIDRGAKIIATPDGNSFYIKWFPAGADVSKTPLIVSLHGSNGFAFHEFYNWYSKALEKGCGIIALQWYRGKNSVSPNDYFDDNAIYSYISNALSAINYPSQKAFLHGFSRGAARSYAVILNDIKKGNKYFCTVLSNSGGAEPGYPLYNDINNGVYGSNVFNGVHWNLFCGGQDPDPNMSGCVAMNNTKQWLQGQGALINIFIQDAVMGHNGFQLQTPVALKYRDSILNNYLQCFNSKSAGNNLKNTGITVFPNPLIAGTTLQFADTISNGTLAVYNSLGQAVQLHKGIYGRQFSFSRSSLQAGIYYVKLLQESSIALTGKMLILQ